MQRIGRKYDPRFPPFEELEDGHNEALLFANAEKIVRHIELDESALNYLYEHRRGASLPRADWERQVRIAHAVDRILRTYFRGIQFGKFEFSGLVDQTAKASVFATFGSCDRSSKGALLLTFHGGFTLIARMLFANVLKDGLQLGANVAGADPRSAMFAAWRAIENGRTLIVAPDGVHGNLSVALNVLGKTFQAGDGAAHLAYAMNCRTAWYTVAREGDRFVPIIDMGPTRIGGESFGEYRNRLYGFYSRKIEAILTGDPRNIILSSRWLSALGGAG